MRCLGVIGAPDRIGAIACKSFGFRFRTTWLHENNHFTADGSIGQRVRMQARCDGDWYVEETNRAVT